MAITTVVKTFLNSGLRVMNLRLETLTAEKAEHRRLHSLHREGHFDRPVFTVPPAFLDTDPQPILDEVGRHARRFEDFREPSRNDVGYSFDNDYFTSPDAEVLYSVVRKFEPNTIVEVGSGNSTKISRQAIRDGGLGTKLISIDPEPRTDIKLLADVMHVAPIEKIDGGQLLGLFREGDILFIDSSHEIKVANDVLWLFLNIIPKLPPGVLLHIHDIFLPFDYPMEWFTELKWGWTEQYLVQCMLTHSHLFEVVWAGHYTQQTRADFARHFPNANGRPALSLWLRKVG